MSRRLPILAAAIFALAGCGGGPTPTNGVAPAEPAFASLTGNPDNGRSAFMQCQTCHSVTGSPGIGPSLHGVVGRRAGSLPGFAYSAAMQSSGVTWTPEALYRFLGAPQGVVPGNRMSFAGIRDAQRRADLIAWLATQ